MDPEKRSRIMVSIRSVSRLELRAKAMAESLAGCRLRLAGPRVGRARSCSQAVIHRIGNERPSNSESNPSGRPVDGKATFHAES